MKITITKQVFQKFPQLKIAIFSVSGISNTKLKESTHLLHEVEEWVKLSFHQDNLKNYALLKPWTVAQQEYGEHAIHYKTSVERLLTLVLRHKKISSDSTITNFTHYLSLKHFIPAAADDLNKIKGDVTFAISQGRERVSLLRKLKAGALFYHDDKGVLGTKLDFWKSSRTKVTAASPAVLFHMEALPPITPQKLKTIIKEAQGLIADFCGGRCKVVVLDKKRNSVNFSDK